MPCRYPLLLWTLLLASPCLAQDGTIDLRRDRGTQLTSSSDDTSSIAVTATPEMWFYEQERVRHDDPKQAIRRRAEARAQQRRDVLASQKWYGISNSRPDVSATPMCGSYGPHWGSNTSDPMRWRPVITPVISQRQVDRY